MPHARFLRWIPTCALLCALPPCAASGPGERALSRHGQVLEQQQREQLQEMQRRALGEAPPPGGAGEVLLPPADGPHIGGDCRPADTIALHGDTSLVPAPVSARITERYAGRCLGAAELETLLASITQSFLDRGLITTRAYLRDDRRGPDPEPDGRVLDIDIVAGTIERYDAEGAIWPGGVFPAKPGDVLNLRDLEQGLEQINRLRSHRARLELRPGTAPGQTVVVVKDEASLPVSLLTAYDNLGTTATGRNAVSAVATFEGLLGANEQISVTRRQSIFPFGGAHRSAATGLRAQLPLGYRTFALDVSRTDYVNTLALPRGARLAVSGATNTYGVGVDHVVLRDQRTRVTVSARLAVQSSRTWADDILLRVASRNLSYAEVGADVTRRIGSGVLGGRVGIAHGLSLFGTRRDPAGLSRELPHAQFTKLTYELGYSDRTGVLPVPGAPLTVSARLTGQLARSSLFGSQQFVIGGPGTVRGFLDHSLSGDSGLLLRTEAGLPWRVQTIPGGPLVGRAYVGFDWGRVGSIARGVPGGALSGVALGVVATWRGMSVDAQLSRAVSAPSPRMREGLLFGMRLTFDL
ncbi:MULTISPECIES: ShlB/FhaC/HecB family hemolysin secretion/activation protein [unclassified Cupriavidus]|uniref:ShlB/FhaC/HecB family hemolysin secretion/activation protein n=1 Tax=unclassified Cupriavidus TaxID=2640874 RepID=UPI00313E60B3